MKAFSHGSVVSAFLIIAFVFLCGMEGCKMRYRLSGQITGDVQEAIKIILTGSFSDNTTTDVDGVYAFEFLDNGTYTVTPFLAGYVFTPASQSVTIAGEDEPDVDFTVAEFDPCDEVDRFLDNNDGTVTDCRTDLIWLKNADCFGGIQTWDTAMSFVAGINSGECGLSDGSVEGDWRLPTRDELQKVGTDPPTTWEGTGNPPVSWTKPHSPDPILNVMSDYYWSGTPHAEDTGLAWRVGMHDGSVYTDVKTNEAYFSWPVRSGD